MTKPLTSTQLKKIAESKDAISLVNSWLNANASYEIVQAQVESIYRDVLDEIAVYNDRFQDDPKFGQRILDVDKMYQSKEEETCKKIYFEATSRMVAEGLLKVADVEGTNPSYVFWDLRKKAEVQIVRMFGHPQGITSEKLFCNGDGVATYKKFIDLCVKAVVSSGKFVREDYSEVK